MEDGFVWISFNEAHAMHATHIVNTVHRLSPVNATRWIGEARIVNS